MKKILVMMIFLLAVQAVSAKEGHMPLLAVSETDSGFEGGIADLYLEIVPGRGRVFIQTFPLTKLDTQISTRFAKEIACQKLDVDCDRYDFFYTIKSNSAIIGGPSAGASISVLTVALLEGWKIDESVAVTGTINSGGVIGAVSGLDKKIEAANSEGITKMLIPKGERYAEINNISIDLVEYGEAMDVEVIEVATLNEVVYEFTGENIETDTEDVEVDASYTEVMNDLAADLCNRSKQIAWSMFLVKGERSAINEHFMEIEAEAQNLSDKSEQALKDKSYYSAASYCFGANVRYRYMLLLLANYSDEDFKKHSEEIRKKSNDFENALPGYDTITDLQTYAIVKERLIEARDELNVTEIYLSLGARKDAAFSLAYATERLYSAFSWSTFFGKGETKMKLTDLKEPCLEKLGEAEERFQYIAYSFPKAVVDRSELNRAYSDFDKGNYVLCLFRASKAKAEADTALIQMGIGERQAEVVETHLEAAKKTIVEQTKKGNFPIVGYSYYEYANSLKGHNTDSALLYSGYSLELSNLDMYFEKETSELRLNVDRSLVISFIAGLALGLAITIPLILKKKSRRR